MTDRKPDLPNQFYRVVWEEGRGFPECIGHRITARNFVTADGAGRQLAAIERWPTHHRLIGVWQSSAIEWTELDPDTIPRPQALPEEPDE